MTGRERDAGLCTKVVTSSSVASPKCVSGGGANTFELKPATVFCSVHCLSKHKITRYARRLGGVGPIAPLAMSMVIRNTE